MRLIAVPFAALLLGCGQQATTASSLVGDARPVASTGAITLPKLTGRVVDDAGLLSDAQEKDLAALSRALEKRSGHQFVVVTLPSLQGHSIEQWGIRLGNGWGIGRKKHDDGVLLIVAPTDRRVRIEVGVGLETVLTDKKAAQIIENDILPEFRAGDLPGGIIAGSKAIVTAIEPGANQ